MAHFIPLAVARTYTLIISHTFNKACKMRLLRSLAALYALATTFPATGRRRISPRWRVIPEGRMRSGEKGSMTSSPEAMAARISSLENIIGGPGRSFLARRLHFV